MMLGLIIGSFSGCAFAPPDCADGYQRDDAGVCQVLPAEGDTGSDPLSGSLTGEIAIDVSAVIDLIDPITDVCSGSVGLDRAGSELSGTVTCRFEGQVDGLLGGETFEGTISGDIADDGTATGPLVLELGIFGVLDASWVGTIDEARLAGDFSGDLLVDVQGVIEANVEYAGSFEARP